MAPELPFDAKKMPIIQKLFKEIGEQNENTEEIPESKIPRDGTLKNKKNLFENHFKNKKSLTFNNLSNDLSIPRNQNQSCGENEITKKNDTRTCLENCYRNECAVFCEDLSHSDFGS